MPEQNRQRQEMVLGDAVAHGILLWATCCACTHRAVLNPAEVAQRCGYDLPVAAVRRHLKCSRCGSREADLTANHDTIGANGRDVSER